MEAAEEVFSLRLKVFPSHDSHLFPVPILKHVDVYDKALNTLCV